MRRTIDAQDVAPISPLQYLLIKRDGAGIKGTEEKPRIMALKFGQPQLRFHIGDHISMSIPSQKQPLQMIVVEEEPDVLAILPKGLNDVKKIR